MPPAPIVAVLRADRIPRYAADALRVARTRTGSEVLLLTDADPTGSDLEGIRVIPIDDAYDPEPFAAFRAATSLDAGFRSGFYLHAAERFFLLAQYARRLGFDRLLHMELDVLLSPLGDLADRLDRAGRGLFVPRDHETRAIASLIYVNDLDVLDRLCTAMTVDAGAGHEMRLLARFLDANPDRAFALPTDAVFRDAGPRWPALDPEVVGGLVDAAALGQWLLGTDPRNGRGPLRNGFRNERAGHDLGRLRFEVDADSGAVRVGRDDRPMVELLCLHVHSKLVGRFADPTELRAVATRLERGRRTVLAWRRRPPD